MMICRNPRTNAEELTGMFLKALQSRGAIVAWADRASYWIFVLLLGYISLVPFYYLQPLSLERVSFHFFKYLPFLLCVALIVARLIVIRQWRGMVDKTDWSMGVYLLCCCLSLIGAKYPGIGAAKLIYYSVTGIGMFYIAQSFDAATLYKILCWVAWFSGCVAIYGVVSYLVGTNFLWDRWYDATHYYSGSHRLSSTLGNPMFLSGFICLTAPILVGEIFVARANLDRALAFVGVMAMAISLILTVTRSAWVAAVFMTVLWLGLCRHRRGTAKKGIQIGIGVVAAVLLLAPVVSLSLPEKTTQTAEYIGNRIGSTGFDNDTIWLRLKLLGIGATEIVSQPLLGLGFGNFTRVFVERHQRAYESDQRTFRTDTSISKDHSLENMYLMFTVETGLVSLGAMLFFWFKRLAGLHRVFSATEDRQQRFLLLAIFVGVCGFLLQILAWDGLNQPATRILFWSLLGTACGIARYTND